MKWKNLPRTPAGIPNQINTVRAVDRADRKVVAFIEANECVLCFCGDVMRSGPWEVVIMMSCSVHLWEHDITKNDVMHCSGTNFEFSLENRIFEDS